MTSNILRDIGENSENEMVNPYEKIKDVKFGMQYEGLSNFALCDLLKNRITIKKMLRFISHAIGEDNEHECDTISPGILEWIRSKR